VRLAALAIVLVGCEDSTSQLNHPAGSGSTAGTIPCAQVAVQVRASYTPDQVATFRSDPTTSAWFDTTMRIVEEACAQDQWPEQLKQCIVGATPGPSSLQTCNQTMPAALQQKLQARMVQAMKTTVKP
jgi:hypothetical protein